MAARHDIIRATEDEYTRLRAAVEGLDEVRMREPWLGTWGVREIVAHITGWHREMMPALARLARGEPPYAEGTYDDFDRWNARFVHQRKDIATADLLRELDRSHRDFVSAVEQLGDEQLAAGGAARGLVDGIGAAHYREHATQIADWRARAAVR